MKLLLEMFVHDINHPIAKSPKEKQRADKTERKEQVLSTLADEHTRLAYSHSVSIPLTPSFETSAGAAAVRTKTRLT